MPGLRVKPRDLSMAVGLPFPYRGIDQSAAYSGEPPLTCRYALNVRGFPPLSDRYGGGKRHGTRRAFSGQVQGFNSDRITGLDAQPVAAPMQTTAEEAEYIRPDSDVLTTGNWYKQGDTPAATYFGSIDETTPNNGTDYITGIATGTNEMTFGSPSFGAGSPPPGSTVTLRFVFKSSDPLAMYDGSGGAAADENYLQFRVYQGASSGGVQILESIAYTDDGSGEWRTGAYVWDDDEVDAVSDWTDLNLLVVVAGDNDHGWFITQVEIEITPANADPTEATPRVLLMTDAYCYVGDLPANELSDAASHTIDGMMPSIAFYGGFWFVCDGDHMQVIEPPEPVPGNTPTVTDWTNVPQDMRLCCMYRGRMVVARQEGGSPNHSVYYMSAVLPHVDPFNTNGLSGATAWSFGDDDRAPAEISAIAGTNKFLGQPADAITALIPYADDYLIFGCSASLWMMQGDPGYGGTVTNLTQQTGVLGSRAWCFDEWGTLWFLGTGGLYKMPRGTFVPVPVSDRRLFRVLDRIDSSAVMPQLVYDAFAKCVYIFLTPTTPPKQSDGYPADDYGLHNVYDIVADAFWFDSFRYSKMGPWSVCQIRGSNADDRRWLIGGNDGYVRRPFDGGKVDDANPDTRRYGTADDMLRAGTGGDPINCVVRYAPIQANAGATELMATELHATGTDNNLPLALPIGSLNWFWLTHDSAAKVNETDPDDAVASGSWFGGSDYGFQVPVGLRQCAGAHQLVVTQFSSAQSFALGDVTAWFRQGPRRRRA